MSCPCGCGGDPHKGGCRGWDDDNWGPTDGESQAEGFTVPGRHLAHRDLKSEKERR